MSSLPPFHHTVLGNTGPWLTFIPGIGNDASFWQVQAEALSQQFRVLCFDPWGHGASPQPPAACGFETIWRGVVALWDQLGIEKSSVVGLGFGGSLALYLGVARPERVQAVVACCCRPRQPDDRRAFWRERQASARQLGLDKLTDITVDRWLSEEFRAQHPEVDQRLRVMMKRTTLEGYLAYVGAFIEMDFTEQLAQLTVPTLLVAAQHDHGGGPLAAMQEMRAAIGHAQLSVVEGVGHIVNHEAPEQVTRILTEFLA